MQVANHMKLECMESEVFLLQEQLSAADSWMEALQQEKGILARDLEAACSMECAALEEISNMFSRAQSTKEKGKHNGNIFGGFLRETD